MGLMSGLARNYGEQKSRISRSRAETAKMVFQENMARLNQEQSNARQDRADTRADARVERSDINAADRISTQYDYNLERDAAKRTYAEKSATTEHGRSMAKQRLINSGKTTKEPKTYTEKTYDEYGSQIGEKVYQVADGKKVYLESATPDPAAKGGNRGADLLRALEGGDNKGNANQPTQTITPAVIKKINGYAENIASSGNDDEFYRALSALERQGRYSKAEFTLLKKMAIAARERNNAAAKRSGKSPFAGLNAPLLKPNMIRERESVPAPAIFGIE